MSLPHQAGESSAAGRRRANQSGHPNFVNTTTLPAQAIANDRHLQAPSRDTRMLSPTTETFMNMDSNTFSFDGKVYLSENSTLAQEGTLGRPSKREFTISFQALSSSMFANPCWSDETFAEFLRLHDKPFQLDELRRQHAEGTLDVHLRKLLDIHSEDTYMHNLAQFYNRDRQEFLEAFGDDRELAEAEFSEDIGFKVRLEEFEELNRNRDARFREELLPLVAPKIISPPNLMARQMYEGQVYSPYAGFAPAPKAQGHLGIMAASYPTPDENAPSYHPRHPSDRHPTIPGGLPPPPDSVYLVFDALRSQGIIVDDLRPDANRIPPPGEPFHIPSDMQLAPRYFDKRYLQEPTGKQPTEMGPSNYFVTHGRDKNGKPVLWNRFQARTGNGTHATTASTSSRPTA